MEYLQYKQEFSKFKYKQEFSKVPPLKKKYISHVFALFQDDINLLYLPICARTCDELLPRPCFQELSTVHNMGVI